MIIHATNLATTLKSQKLEQSIEKEHFNLTNNF